MAPTSRLSPPRGLPAATPPVDARPAKPADRETADLAMTLRPRHLTGAARPPTTPRRQLVQALRRGCDRARAPFGALRRRWHALERMRAREGTWELHAAPLSSDVLLVETDARGHVVAFVPPMTPICDPDSGELNRTPRWRRATWLRGDEELSYAVPDLFVAVPVQAVADAVDERWTAWVRDETRRRIELLLGAIQPVGWDVILEDRARALQSDVDRLRAEAVLAFPNRSWALIRAVASTRPARTGGALLRLRLHLLRDRRPLRWATAGALERLELLEWEAVAQEELASGRAVHHDDEWPIREPPPATPEQGDCAPWA